MKHRLLIVINRLVAAQLIEGTVLFNVLVPRSHAPHVHKLGPAIVALKCFHEGEFQIIAIITIRNYPGTSPAPISFF